MQNGLGMLRRVPVPRRSAALLALLLLVSSCAAKAMRGASGRALGRSDRAQARRCTLYAAPGGHRHRRRGRRGRLDHPFRTVQALLNALRPGSVGCLLGGIYRVRGQLRVNRGGRRGRWITLTSAPGQSATLVGGVVNIPPGSNYVALTHLRINTRGVDGIGIQLMGNHDTLASSNITNHNSRGSCIVVGYTSPAKDVAIVNNVIHQCGHNPGDPHEDHGVYVDYAIDAVIANNVFWGIPDGWGVQMYPEAIGTQVVHNVIDDNGEGVVFAGDGSSASSGNVVAYNIITSTARGYDVSSSWDGPVGRGNVARENCLSGGRERALQRPSRGFSTSHNRLVSPAFVAAKRHDYRLQPDSPCLAVVGYDAAAYAGPR